MIHFARQGQHNLVLIIGNKKKLSLHNFYFELK